MYEYAKVRGILEEVEVGEAGPASRPSTPDAQHRRTNPLDICVQIHISRIVSMYNATGDGNDERVMRTRYE